MRRKQACPRRLGVTEVAAVKEYFHGQTDLRLVDRAVWFQAKGFQFIDLTVVDRIRRRLTARMGKNQARTRLAEFKQVSCNTPLFVCASL